MTIALAIILAYLIGSFPSAYLIGRLKLHTDIREVGSRNMGAMNVFYKAGFWNGMLVLGLDIGKGAGAVALARFLGTDDIVQYLAGFAVLLGHNFPVFLRFRGGKGGATCIGILAFFMPLGVPIYAGIFLLLLWLTRFPTLSYSIAFFPYISLGWFIYHRLDLVIYSCGILLFVVFRYVSRVKEMRSKGGSWRRVLNRKGLNDRL
ncbi:MAG: glycerol-3-phosphate acyltransferase [Dehalococcoidales bacterium]|nr:glycerol-3-phosphate acyltransferase [Dehalococcoidales bacterium]